MVEKMMADVGDLLGRALGDILGIRRHVEVHSGER